MKKAEGTPASGSGWKWVKLVAPLLFSSIRLSSIFLASLPFPIQRLQTFKIDQFEYHCGQASIFIPFVHTCTVFWNFILTAPKEGIPKTSWQNVRPSDPKDKLLQIGLDKRWKVVENGLRITKKIVFFEREKIPIYSKIVFEIGDIFLDNIFQKNI